MKTLSVERLYQDGDSSYKRISFKNPNFINPLYRQRE